MQTLSKSRQRRLNIRLSQQEWESVKKLADHTTCRSISEYARQLLLDKPVRVFYRNQSFDDFEQLMIRLLADLEDHGNKLNGLLAQPAVGAITAPGTATAPGAATASGANPDLYTVLRQLLACQRDHARKTEEIKEAIIKIADQCVQK